MANFTKSSKVASLIPNGEKLVEAGFNVMLIGKHGTGKTESVRELAETMGLKFIAYSCSTLDPFTDLVGVPMPKTDDEGNEYLTMVRPTEIDNAEFIFFDEFNRTRKEVLDAVLEIINNRSINGKLLPNLKCCWAAINPPGEEYQVDDLDPALIDRFDSFIEFMPRPSIAYMSQHMSRPVAQAVKAWYDDHNKAKRETYISPRRLVKIGKMFEVTKNKRSVIQALPPGGNYDSNKLYEMLEEAANPAKKKSREEKAINTTPNADFDYTSPHTLLSDDKKLSKHLSENPTDFATHQEVAKVLADGISGSFLVLKFGNILNSLNAAILEKMMNGLPQPKQSQLRTAFADVLQEHTATSMGKDAKTWRNLHSAINNVTKQAGKKLPPL